MLIRRRERAILPVTSVHAHDLSSADTPPPRSGFDTGPRPDPTSEIQTRRALAEFSRAGRHGRLLSLDEKQQVRLHRFKIAALTTVLASVIVGGFAVLGTLEPRDFASFVGGSGLLMLLFLWLFRSGHNLKSADPSLTLPMMLSALGMLLFIMARARGSHDLISILYVLPFVFGALRLETRQLLALAAGTLIVDLLIAIHDPDRLAGEATFQLELVRWFALAVVLMWLSVMAGFLSSLRADLVETNRRLGDAADEIRHLVTHDELTGISNRRHLLEVLAAEQARTVRYGSAWSVCIVDVDFFRCVNDKLGHAAADGVLRALAGTLQAAVRPTDTVGRFTGERFMIVLAQTTLDSAGLTAERIRSITETTTYPGLESGSRITVSVGVAEHRAGEIWRDTVERADRALHLAKNAGRNRVEVDDGARALPLRGRGLPY